MTRNEREELFPGYDLAKLVEACNDTTITAVACVSAKSLARNLRKASAGLVDNPDSVGYALEQLEEYFAGNPECNLNPKSAEIFALFVGHELRGVGE